MLSQQVVLSSYKAVYMSRWDMLMIQMRADSSCLPGQEGFPVVVVGAIWSADHCCEFAATSGSNRCLLGCRWLLNNRGEKKEKRGLFFSLHPTWVAAGDTKMSEKEITLFFLRARNGITTEKHAHGLTLQQLLEGKQWPFISWHAFTGREIQTTCLFVKLFASCCCWFPHLSFFPSLTRW